MKKDKTYMTSTERKALKDQKKRRGVATLVILLILSITLNVFLIIQNISLPKINVPHRLPLLDFVAVDNEQFAQRIDEKKATFDFVVNDSGKKMEYELANAGDKSVLTVTENDDYFSRVECDFTIDKWDELRALVLKYQLYHYNESEHVDSYGRVVERNDKYILELDYDYFYCYELETPKNAEQIEKFFVELYEAANASPDKKVGSSSDVDNPDFIGHFETISVSYNGSTYTLTDRENVCGFSYKGDGADYSCSFVPEKMEHVKELLLKNDLKWAESEEKADADGKVTYVSYDSPYTVKLFGRWDYVGKRIVTPDNIDEIMAYLNELAESAKN